MNEPIENKEYRIERLTRDTIPDMETLYATVYKKSPPKGFFDKKYDSSYTGKAYISHIAYNDQNIPIASNGVVPCYIEYDKKTILAAQFVDVMTHPAYRYNGLFVELSNICFDLCRANNIMLLFAFPNQNSYPGAVNKLGWKMTETMDCFNIPVKSLKLKNIFYRFAITKNMYKKYERKVLDKYLTNEFGISNSVVKDGFGGVCRTKEYFGYKRYSTTQVIKIGTSKLWIKINNSFTIGDIELNENDFDTVINAAKKIARKLGVANIYFHTCKQTALHKIFESRYTAMPSFPVLFQDFGSAIPPQKIKFTFADIDIF